MKFHQLPIETHENPPCLLVKFTSLRPGHGALAFALGSPFCRCQSHGGTPSSHPFIDWIFHKTIQLLEYPHDYGNSGFDMWHDLL